jgi:hypothetical protein
LTPAFALTATPRSVSFVASTDHTPMLFGDAPVPAAAVTSRSARSAVTVPTDTAYSGFVPTSFALPPAFAKSHVTPE